MKDSLFYKLNCRIDTEKILDYESKNRHRYFTIFGFDMFSIPKELVKECPLIDVIEKFDGTPFLLKMEPWKLYSLHTDDTRQCAINSLLSGYDSYSYFGNSIDKKLIYEIIPIDYTLGNTYLFNTKHEHAVMNRTERRLNFSIGFRSNRYEEILEYCQQQNV